MAQIVVPDATTPCAVEVHQLSSSQVQPAFETRVEQSLLLNEEICVCLQGGKNEQAVAKCRQALGILKHELATMDSREEARVVRQQQQQQLGGEGQEDDSSLGDQYADGTPGDLRIRAGPVPSGRGPEGRSFAYTHVMRFLRSDGVGSVDVHLLSAVVILNMALSYLTARTSNGSTRGTSLRLYETCLRLVERPSHDGVEYRILRSVCLNNMAHVAYERCDYGDARGLLEDLMHSLDETDFFLHEFFGEGVVQGFVLNFILMHPPTSAPAA